MLLLKLLLALLLLLVLLVQLLTFLLPPVQLLHQRGRERRKDRAAAAGPADSSDSVSE